MHLVLEYSTIYIIREQECLVYGRLETGNYMIATHKIKGQTNLRLSSEYFKFFHFIECLK